MRTAGIFTVGLVLAGGVGVPAVASSAPTNSERLLVRASQPASGQRSAPPSSTSGGAATSISDNIVTSDEPFHSFDDDDRLARETRSIPGFGGYYVNGRGKLVLVVVKGVNKSRVASYARSTLPGFRSLARSETTVFAEGAYSFTDLNTWKDAIRNDAFQLPGIATLDIDETTNTLVIGLTDPAAVSREQLDELALRHNVPPEAIVTAEDSLIAPTSTTVRERRRPIIGGLQTTFESSYFGYTNICTFGSTVMLATDNDGGQRYFLTNSHCSILQGGDQDTKYWQNSKDGSDEFVGVEFKDPPYQTGGDCPAGYACRRSDSLLVKKAPSPVAEVGLVARTLNRGYVGGSDDALTIDADNPSQQLRATPYNLFVGKIVDKVGRTTGWTHGNITRDCIDAHTADGAYYDCQYYADLGQLGGDSGAVVFDQSENNALGLAWGSPQGATTTVVFSGLRRVESELGDLVFNPQ